ncbi:MAG: DUF2909 domain-containing protein [Pseudomonadales bacterium]
MLKVIILVLFAGVVVSLFSGLAFLFKDTERPESRRTLHALGVRITLAIALLATIAYGLYTGELGVGAKAPWHARMHGTESAD